MDYLLYVDDSLIIAIMQVSLILRCLRISWILIIYIDFIPCCLSEVTHRVMIDWVQLEVFERNWVSNKGFVTPNKGRGYSRPLVGIITRESLFRVGIP